jgi:hypothetical protein
MGVGISPFFNEISQIINNWMFYLHKASIAEENELVKLLNDFYATSQVPGNLKIDYRESPTLCTDRGDSPLSTQWEATNAVESDKLRIEYFCDLMNFTQLHYRFCVFNSVSLVYVLKLRM